MVNTRWNCFRSVDNSLREYECVGSTGSDPVRTGEEELDLAQYRMIIVRQDLRSENEAAYTVADLFPTQGEAGVLRGPSVMALYDELEKRRT